MDSGGGILGGSKVGQIQGRFRGGQRARDPERRDREGGMGPFLGRTFGASLSQTEQYAFSFRGAENTFKIP